MYEINEYILYISFLVNQLLTSMSNDNINYYLMFVYKIIKIEVNGYEIMV